MAERFVLGVCVEVSVHWVCNGALGLSDGESLTQVQPQTPGEPIEKIAEQSHFQAS
jgi:hypothetical protein